MLSIIIPVYNTEQYIEQCLESVANQTCQESMECILVDDCGTDNSLGICEQFIQNYHGEIVFRIVKHSHNRGLSAARNTGIQAAKGDYITFIDSDDYVGPNLFAILLEAFRKQDSNVAIVGCNAYMDTEGVIEDFIWKYDEPFYVSPSDYAEKHLLLKVPHAMWAKVYRKEVFDNTLFREGYVNEDILFHLDVHRFIEQEKLFAYYLPEKLYYYRQRENSICRNSEQSFYLHVLNNMEHVILSLKNENEDLSNKVKQKFIHKLIYHTSIASSPESIEHRDFSTLCSMFKKVSNKSAFRLVEVKSFLVFLFLKYIPKAYYLTK